MIAASHNLLFFQILYAVFSRMICQNYRNALNLLTTCNWNSIMKKHFYTLLLVLGSVLFSSVSMMAQDVNAIINKVKKEYAPDSRVAIWNVEVKKTAQGYDLSGKTTLPEAKEALLKELGTQKIKYNDRITVLPDASLKQQWALVSISVACLRTDAKNSAELASQAIMGTPMKVLEKADNGMYRVQTPDGYIGYMTSGSFQLLSEKEMNAWRAAKRYVVTAYQPTMYGTPAADDTNVVSDLLLGNILEYVGQEAGFLKLKTPDGRMGYVAAADVAELEEWSRQEFDIAKIERNARRMMGVPYLWGGTSAKTVDCSGFMKTIYFSNGIILQRDASQQALTGKKINWRNWRTEAEKGDLIFIGTKSGRVTHVAMYLDDGRYIHSSGRVKINSMNPDDADYLDYTFLSMSRIKGQVGTKGIVSVSRHPWYFVKTNLWIEENF